ncbi:MAG: hypothetical protein KAX19_09185, partial [Candidatus Brocadiae bacterium]|nr:hypothetical protein [Candidatus Brocadiia bacterium]
NALPNSSFECGGAGWGCWAPGMPGWGAQVFRRLGEWDTERGFDGGSSWKLSLSADEPEMVYFDYYDPVEAPIRALLLGHEGWVPVERGQSYVFSAYVMADRAELPVRMVIWEAGGPRHERTLIASTQWQRVQLAFAARADFACGFVGLDLREADRPEGTVWLDALQFEQGTEATPYLPRSELGTRIETDRAGNIFTDPDQGLTVRLRAYNATDRELRAGGRLTITDYVDRTVWDGTPEIALGPGQSGELEYAGLLAGRRGFFRVRWEPRDGLPQELRCAVIEPSEEQDSRFGMNHAFCSEFLLRLAHLAGVRWWRDWSVKWETVQPKPDGFDFSIPDAQIDRVLDAEGQVLVLFPFPSALWAATPDQQMLAEAAGDNAYLKQRLPTSLKPDRLEDFAAYIRAGVEHYRDRIN